MFRHHPDGWITLNGFIYPLSEFLIDEPAYALPAGMIAREYVPGQYHRVFDGQSQFDGGYPWPDGDLYLSRVAQYRAAYTARLNPPPTLAQAKDTANKTLTLACTAAITAGFISPALGAPYTYPSTLLDQHNLNARVTESQVRAADATWTCKFMCRDATGVWARRAHTHAQIERVGTDAVAHVSAQLDHLDAKRAEIDASTTVAAVEAITW